MRRQCSDRNVLGVQCLDSSGMHQEKVWVFPTKQSNFCGENALLFSWSTEPTAPSCPLLFLKVGLQVLLFFFFWAETAAWTDSRWARRKDDSPSYRLFRGEQQGVDVFKSLKFWLVYPLDDVPEEKEEGEDGKNEKVLLRYKPRNTKTSVVTLNQGLWGDSCSPRFFQGADTKDAFRSAPMPTDI